MDRNHVITLALFALLFGCVRGDGEILHQDLKEEMKETSFSTPADASRKISGSLNSIVTSRIITGRAITARMENIDIGVGGAPGISGKIFETLVGWQTEGKMNTKSENGKSGICRYIFPLSSCSDLNELCDVECREIREEKRETMMIELSASSCSVRRGNGNITYSGKISLRTQAIYSDAYTSCVLEAEFSDARIEISDDSGVYSLSLSPTARYEIHVSVYPLDVTRVKTNFSLYLDGRIGETNEREKVSRVMTFRGMSVSGGLELFFDGEGISLSDVLLSLDGRYSVETKPTWCGDGIFDISTRERLKVKLMKSKKEEEISCPISGVLLVNNSEIGFEGDKVLIRVGNAPFEYTCRELLSACPYDGNALDFVTIYF